MLQSPPPSLLLILESLCLLRGRCERSPVTPWTSSSTSRACSWTTGRRGILSNTKLVDECSNDDKEDQEKSKYSEVLPPPGRDLPSKTPDYLLRLRGTEQLISRNSRSCGVGSIQLFLLVNIGLSDAKSIRYFLSSCSDCCGGGLVSLLLVLHHLKECLEDTPGVRLGSSCPHAAFREEFLSITGEKLFTVNTGLHRALVVRVHH